MNNKVKCPVCGTEFSGGSFDDCPYCDWTYEFDDYTGMENDTDGVNPISLNQAKKLFSEGKNIWGDPLPEKK